ncbi:MAG: YegP family protein [Solobacterium sp.]|nr:YegP family protein [Solobacterium sp.]
MAIGKFVVKATKNGGVKFDLKASNGETILTSQTYKSLKSCTNGIASVVRNAAVAAIEDQTVEGFQKEKCPKFEIYQDKAGESRFRLKATNGQIIGVSEGYKSLKTCKNGIASVVKNAPEAAIKQLEE